MSCCGGNCGCGPNCKCGGNGCTATGCEVEATATKTTVLVAAIHKASSGGFEMAAENGGCDCNTCKCGTSCGCPCCNCN